MIRLPILCFLLLQCFAAAAVVADTVEKPLLRFQENGRFRIVQFTDLHLQYDSYRSDSVLSMMRSIIESEQPDLVMLTGDVVGSDHRIKAWHKVAQVMIDAKTPWAALLGNHDAEYEIDKAQTMQAIVGLPYNLTVSGPAALPGAGNYTLPIHASASDKIAALCYVFDSPEEKPTRETAEHIEWIDPRIVRWYEAQSDSFTAQHGGKPYPALAFIHIPLPEFKKAAVGKTYGVAAERQNPIPTSKPSNLFRAFQQKGDIMAVFAGHEHNNNYMGCFEDIALAYGQTSGRQVYGDLGAGARVIELHEGKQTFDSWIIKRYDNNREQDLWLPTQTYHRQFFASYPDAFVPEKIKGDRIELIRQQAGTLRFSLSGTGTVEVDWGDGTAPQRYPLPAGEALELEHHYASAHIPQHIRIQAARIQTLSIPQAGLYALDVSHCPELTYLDCSSNQLSHLDLRHNKVLQVLWCQDNQLALLRLQENKALKELYCFRNRLTKLDVSQNPALVWLNCYQNYLRTLDVRHNPSLRRLDCYENQLTELDLQQNPALYWVVCSDNDFQEQGLNSLFMRLNNDPAKGAAKIFIGGNPGERFCNKQLAKKNNWKVNARY